MRGWVLECDCGPRGRALAAICAGHRARRCEMHLVPRAEALGPAEPRDRENSLLHTALSIDTTLISRETQTVRCKSLKNASHSRSDAQRSLVCLSPLICALKPAFCRSMRD